ncbi:hypothetical protein D3C85_1226910 [compost metagenome]
MQARGFGFTRDHQPRRRSPADILQLMDTAQHIEAITVAEQQVGQYDVGRLLPGPGQLQCLADAGRHLDDHAPIVQDHAQAFQDHRFIVDDQNPQSAHRQWVGDIHRQASVLPDRLTGIFKPEADDCSPPPD